MLLSKFAVHKVLRSSTHFVSTRLKLPHRKPLGLLPVGVNTHSKSSKHFSAQDTKRLSPQSTPMPTKLSETPRMPSNGSAYASSGGCRSSSNRMVSRRSASLANSLKIGSSITGHFFGPMPQTRNVFAPLSHRFFREKKTPPTTRYSEQSCGPFNVKGCKSFQERIMQQNSSHNPVSSLTANRENPNWQISISAGISPKVSEASISANPSP